MFAIARLASEKPIKLRLVRADPPPQCLELRSIRSDEGPKLDEISGTKAFRMGVREGVEQGLRLAANQDVKGILELLPSSVADAIREARAKGRERPHARPLRDILMTSTDLAERISEAIREQRSPNT